MFGDHKVWIRCAFHLPSLDTQPIPIPLLSIFASRSRYQIHLHSDGHASNLGSSAQQDFAVTLVTNWIFLALHSICPYWYYRKHLRRQAELMPTRTWGEVPWQRECPWMQYLGERAPNNSRCFTILRWWNHNEDHLTGIYRFHLFSQNMIWGYYRYLSMFAFVQSLQTLSLS